MGDRREFLFLSGLCDCVMLKVSGKKFVTMKGKFIARNNQCLSTEHETSKH